MEAQLPAQRGQTRRDRLPSPACANESLQERINRVEGENPKLKPEPDTWTHRSSTKPQPFKIQRNVYSSSTSHFAYLGWLKTYKQKIMHYFDKYEDMSSLLVPALSASGCWAALEDREKPQ